MTLVLVAALVAVSIAHIWLADRKDNRAHAERNTQREEVQMLLQRIQAPELAVITHQQQAIEIEPVQPPLTDTEIAERDEMIANIERAENEMLGLLN